MAAAEGDEPPLPHSRLLPARDQAGQIGTMNQVPFQPRFETWQRFDQLPLDSFHREQRHEADARSHLQRQISPARRAPGTIVKLVLLVPKTDPAAADIV